MIKIIEIFFLITTFLIIWIPFSESFKNRIIGGENVEINQTPYLVSVRYKKYNNTAFEHRCSGTISSAKVILTTATCIIGLESNRLHIKAGSSYRSQIDGFLYVVEKYILHPDYNIWFFDNDLALVILAFDLGVNVPKKIAPIALATEVPVEGSLATIAGWGLADTSANNNFSEVLQIANVELVNDSVCKRSYGENRISRSMLCAAGNHTDACQGDAGGALVYKNTALGLISWGNGCANTDFPGVYTNLVYFREWIENEIAKL